MTQHSMKKIYYHKLIRDGVAAKMKRNGVAFQAEKLDRASYEKALLAKLEEEAGGVVSAESNEELMQELADVLTVIEEIKRFKKIRPSELRAAWKENMKKKGGFAKRLWLVWSQDTGYKTNEKRGTSRRKK